MAWHEICMSPKQLTGGLIQHVMAIACAENYRVSWLVPDKIPLFRPPDAL